MREKNENTKSDSANANRLISESVWFIVIDIAFVLLLWLIDPPFSIIGTAVLGVLSILPFILLMNIRQMRGGSEKRKIINENGEKIS